jgi:hypothetical protein
MLDLNGSVLGGEVPVGFGLTDIAVVSQFGIRRSRQAETTPNSDSARSRICAIAWAIKTTSVFRASAPLIVSAERILSGDTFDAAQLSALRRRLDAAQGGSLGLAEQHQPCVALCP